MSKITHRPYTVIVGFPDFDRSYYEDTILIGQFGEGQRPMLTYVAHVMAEDVAQANKAAINQCRMANLNRYRNKDITAILTLAGHTTLEWVRR